MNFQKLKYAVVVADSGSFREAARRLFMAQSSLSTAIRELEEMYDLQIFERTKRGIFITEEGSEFLSYARDVLSQVSVMENRYLDADRKKLFSVSSQHYDFVSEAFAVLIANDEDRAHHYRLLETSTTDVMENVKNAYSEIGILYMNAYNQKVIKQYLNHNELSYTEIGAFQPHVFVGKQHPLADRESLTQADLLAYPSVTFEQTQGSSAQLTEEALDLGEGSTQSTIYVSDRATSINVLVKTDAILVGTGILTSPFRDMMTTVPVTDVEDNHIIYIQNKYRKLSSEAERFIGILNDQLNDVIGSADS